MTYSAVQPDQDVQFENNIGAELKDPNWNVSSRCPSGRDCRKSDSALFEYYLGVNSTDAFAIAVNPNSGDETIDYTVLNDGAVYAAGQPVGAPIGKTGQNTGTTTGTVESTCLRINQSDSNFTVLCNNQGTYNSIGGDSGSPVFYNAGQRKFAGIHWGGNGTYSPIEYVFEELDLDVVNLIYR